MKVKHIMAILEKQDPEKEVNISVSCKFSCDHGQDPFFNGEEITAWRTDRDSIRFYDAEPPAWMNQPKRQRLPQPKKDRQKSVMRKA